MTIYSFVSLFHQPANILCPAPINFFNFFEGPITFCTPFHTLGTCHHQPFCFPPSFFFPCIEVLNVSTTCTFFYFFYHWIFTTIWTVNNIFWLPACKRHLPLADRHLLFIITQIMQDNPLDLFIR